MTDLIVTTITVAVVMVLAFVATLYLLGDERPSRIWEDDR